MQAAGRALDIAVAELLDRILANRLEHPEARLPGVVGVREHERRVEQRVERTGDVGRRVVDDVLDRLERRGRGEDAERGEHPLGRLVQQADAPVDRRAERALPFRQVGRTSCEEREPPADPLRHPFRPENPDPGGGELDREWKAVERPADARDGRDVVVTQLEARQHGLRARHEHTHGVHVTHLVDRRDLGSGNPQGRDAVLVLGREPERRPARHEHP